MPVLTINTNIKVETDPAQIVRELSALCANMLGKPESYVMVQLNQQQNLIFAGTDEAAALCSLTSLGMNDNNTASYSASLCGFLQERLGIPPARTYIEFKSPERSMFGWNNATL